jgi:hypothetical protein
MGTSCSSVCCDGPAVAYPQPSKAVGRHSRKCSHQAPKAMKKEIGRLLSATISNGFPCDRAVSALNNPLLTGVSVNPPVLLRHRADLPKGTGAPTTRSLIPAADAPRIEVPETAENQLPNGNAQSARWPRTTFARPSGSSSHWTPLPCTAVRWLAADGVDGIRRVSLVSITEPQQGGARSQEFFLNGQPGISVCADDEASSRAQVPQAPVEAFLMPSDGLCSSPAAPLERCHTAAASEAACWDEQ